MPRPIRRHRMLSLAWLGAVVAPLAGQTSPTAAPDTSLPAASPPAAAGPAPASASLKPPSFKLSGYAEASYDYSTQAVANAIVGRLYDRFSGGFTLNALKLTVDRPYMANKLDAGVHADVLVGQNAAVLQSSGFSLGSDGDVTQLYVTLNVPTANGNGVQLKAGKMATLMGLEVIEDVANPNWSEGNQFIFVENFTGTGVEVDYKFSPSVDAEARVDNGWDRVQVNHGHADFMGRLGLAPGPNTSIGVLGYVGAQEESSSAARYGADLLVNQKLGPVSLWLQADYGKEQANAALPDSTRDASWWAVGTWLAYDVTPKLNLALRADYLDDAESARTGAAFALPGALAHKLWSGTATLNVKSWSNVLVRPEVRYDHSNFTPFKGKNGQATFAVSVAYLY